MKLIFNVLLVNYSICGENNSVGLNDEIMRCKIYTRQQPGKWTEHNAPMANRTV